MVLESLLVLLLAIAIDLALGDPPDIAHPVAWMGKIISWLEKGGTGRRPLTQFFYGALITIFTVGIFAVPVYFIILYVEGLNTLVYVIVASLLLKSTFSVRGLWQAALKVKRLLLGNHLEEARFEMRSLVSRDTRELSGALIAAATVESVSENASDSFVAPLFYFLLFGVPGAVAYRVVNTLDSQIGYHGKYEYLGKFACRLDDILNFIPARLTALLLVLSAFVCRRNGRESWKVAVRDHVRTESPNAGWPMAAISGALGLSLEKEGHYHLGEAANPPVPEMITDSLKLVLVAMSAWVLICFLIGGIYFVFTA